MPSFENDAINFHLNERMKEEINSHHVCVKLFKYPKVNLACAQSKWKWWLDRSPCAWTNRGKGKLYREMVV